MLDFVPLIWIMLFESPNIPGMSWHVIAIEENRKNLEYRFFNILMRILFAGVHIRFFELDFY